MNMAIPQNNTPSLSSKAKQEFGRPPKYKSAYQMLLKIDEYFSDCEKDDKNPKYPSLEGLALFLGFSAWASVEDYSSKNTHFEQIIKRAHTRVVAGLLQIGMAHPQRSTMCMFRVKKHDTSYREVQGVDHGGKITFQVVSGIPEPNPPTLKDEQPKQLSDGND